MKRPNLFRLLLLYQLILFDQSIDVILFDNKLDWLVPFEQHHLKFGLLAEATKGSFNEMNLTAADFVTEAMKLQMYELRYKQTKSSYAYLYQGNSYRCLLPLGCTSELVQFLKPGGPNDEVKPRLTKRHSIEWLAKNSKFNPDQETVILIPGWLTPNIKEQKWSNLMKNLLLIRASNTNVFFVDWKYINMLPYPLARLKMAKAGQDVFEIIKNLRAAFPSWNWTNMHLIGVSLGTHVAGRIGYLLGGKINQITSLDSADTLISEYTKHEFKLTRDDAKYVISIHTDSKYLGTPYHVADIDVFINGGERQPECTSMGPFGSECRHLSSALYHSNYMGKCIMVGYLANSYAQFKKGQVGFCDRNSSDCIGIGNSWQYEDGPLMTRDHFRPANLEQTKAERGRDWSLDGPKYFMDTSGKPPQCVFTYQVVAKFESSSRLASRPKRGGKAANWLSIELAIGTAAGSIRVNLTEFGGDRELRVFSKNGTIETISGRKIYTGLAVIENEHPMYNSMPARLTLARIVSLPAARRQQPKRAQTRNRKRKLRMRTRTRKHRKNNQPIEVYANFMSDNRFEMRQFYSGRIEVSSD